MYKMGQYFYGKIVFVGHIGVLQSCSHAAVEQCCYGDAHQQGDYGDHSQKHHVRLVMDP